MKRFFWDLRWSLPRNKSIRENGETVGYAPRPPSGAHPGETPKQFRDRLAWALADHAGFLKRERLP